MSQNVVSIRIDVRSSLSLLVFAIIAILMTIFVLNKANEAIAEINALSEQPSFNGGEGE